MSAVTAIYNAPISNILYDNNSVSLEIKYNGRVYHGKSICHEDDKDFYSKKVGYNIALSRARIKALVEEQMRVEEEVKWKIKIYEEVARNKFNPEEMGKLPSPEVWRNYERAVRRNKTLIAAIKKEKTNLKLYLEGQVKAIDSIKRFRNKDNNN